ncbi:unnamed protein product [Ambrosiozyma monospora]|uniref:Unnamed protein product n=1 Tax=Ambrosiozyma monospora TaxID=43982 RepID=A0A9W6Z5M1_AMBMO|nr:unnamed protein product [Ambrosiozyma monospora]
MYNNYYNTQQQGQPGQQQQQQPGQPQQQQQQQQGYPANYQTATQYQYRTGYPQAGYPYNYANPTIGGVAPGVATGVGVGVGPGALTPHTTTSNSSIGGGDSMKNLNSNDKSSSGNKTHHSTISGSEFAPLSPNAGQIQPPGLRPKITTTMWEDEKTLCYQVEANGVAVVRRADNNMINGTKLLNVAKMTRGRRDGILKSEKTRQVVKIGSMHLKGVWIPFERALAMAQRESIVDMLYPLFVKDIKRVIQQGTPTAQVGQITLGARDDPSITTTNNNTTTTTTTTTTSAAAISPTSDKKASIVSTGSGSSISGATIDPQQQQQQQQQSNSSYSYGSAPGLGQPPQYYYATAGQQQQPGGSSYNYYGTAGGSYYQQPPQQQQPQTGGADASGIYSASSATTGAATGGAAGQTTAYPYAAYASSTADRDHK